MVGQVWSWRTGRLIAAIAVIAAGLALRRFGYDLGLPFLFVKYGGSVLWGAMVYLLAGALLPTCRRETLSIASIVIAACVELSRLYHTPWLDAFRLTTAGALLLGRVFSLWNIAAYVVGIGAVLLLERLVVRPAKH